MFKGGKSRSFICNFSVAVQKKYVFIAGKQHGTTKPNVNIILRSFQTGKSYFQSFSYLFESRQSDYDKLR